MARIIFKLFQIFLIDENLLLCVGSRMDLEDTIRNLIRREFAADMRMNLTRIAKRTGVDYKRLWSFLQDKNPGRISAAEAQQVYEILSGNPLLPNENDL